MEKQLKMETPGLKIIALSEIFLSDTNPRKTFDQQALEDLAASILVNGLLQPILVRPKDGKYQLVCGERRYRASMSVAEIDQARNAVPVIIRDLTDDEVFEVQIVENLERKDVHPLEEADAFKKMLDCGRYSLADVAAKLARTETFVLQRMRLTTLINKIREEFLQEKLGIAQAVIIARCAPELQQKIAEAYQYNEQYGTVESLKKSIERLSRILSEAYFDTKSETLVPGCTSCDLCPKRSGYNPLLFPDMTAEDRCFDDTCFTLKTEMYVIQKISQILNDGEDVKFVGGYSDPSPAVAKALKENKVPMLKTYEDYTNYKTAGFAKAKALVVCGSEMGMVKDIYLNPRAKSTNADGNSGDEASLLRTQIANIDTRQKRALELDSEKVWSRIQGIPRTDIERDTSPLSPNEKLAFLAALFEKMDWGWKDAFVKEFPNFRFRQYEESIKILSVSDEMLNRVSRWFLFNALLDNYGSHKSMPKPHFFTLALAEHRRSEIEALETEQLEIAAKRVANAESKKKALQVKLDSLTPDEPEAPKKRTKVTKSKATA